jgi:trehalose/maltose hydrolase-like predicted phosphorylase
MRGRQRSHPEVRSTGEASGPGSLFEVTEDPRWLLVTDDWSALTEPAVEGAFALVNGYLGARGAVEEGSAVSTPATFLNGVFDTATVASAQAASTPGLRIVAAPTPELVVAPDWSKLRVALDGARLTTETAEVLTQRRTLDLRRGVLIREWRLRMGGRTTLLRSLRASAGRTWRLEKVVTVFTSRDGPAPADCAVKRLAAATAIGLPALLARSAAAWAGRWATADVEISGDEELQRRIRFGIYHLIGCANPDDPHAAPGARSLTGERYKGHVFWDTETFVLPFFVYTHPATARAVLGYRYRTLPAARENARAHGWRGAAYAWESADTGEDVTPAYYFTADGKRKDTRTGQEEHHLNADIGLLSGSTGRPPGTRSSCSPRALRCCSNWRGSGARGPSAALTGAGTSTG